MKPPILCCSRLAPLILSAAALLLPAPGVGQTCLGGGTWTGPVLVRGGVGAIAGVPVLSGQVAFDAHGRLGGLVLLEYASPDSGDGVHLGARGRYTVGSPLGAQLCLTAGGSVYRSKAQPLVGGTRDERAFRIFAPTAGMGVGTSVYIGRLSIHPYARVEGQLLFKQSRFSAGGDYGGYSNEGRAVTAIGIAFQRGRFTAGAAWRSFPGTASILEASYGEVPAGGHHVGYEISAGLYF